MSILYQEECKSHIFVLLIRWILGKKNLYFYIFQLLSYITGGLG